MSYTSHKIEKAKVNGVVISRRKFLSFLSALPLVGTLSFASNSKKISNEDELILVNGWVLKKKDLDVI